MLKGQARLEKIISNRQKYDVSVCPAIQAGINHGVYEIVRNTATGELIGIARNKVTGQFVAHAVGMTTASAGLAIDPLIASAQVVMGSLQMVQTHMGFQKTYQMLDALQTSVAVLQSATAVIGIGTVVSTALSAVNLHQTLKLREDVKQLRLEVKDGFIDMKQALKDRGEEVIQRIDQVAKDIKFEHHRTILVQAYGRFIEAMDCLQEATILIDANLRNSNIEAARGKLRNALADYNNIRLFEDTSSAGQLRRRECAWAIHQAVTITYQMQGAHEVVSDRLSQLQNKIRQDAQGVINCCESQDELDFLFPELTRIYNHDLAVLKSWQNHIDWMQTLPSDQQQMLASLDIPTADTDSNENSIVVAEPEERSLYENLKQKSHYLSLRDQLQFMVKPDLRRTHESYITQQAAASDYKALAPSNWQEISDLTVANLYWYFKVKE